MSGGGVGGCVCVCVCGGGGGVRVGVGGSSYNGLCEEVPPKRVTFFRFQVMKGYGFHQLKYMKA